LLESTPAQGTKLRVMVRTHLAAAMPQATDRLRPAKFSPQDFTENHPEI
jgi:hypothetical protein